MSRWIPWDSNPQPTGYYINSTGIALIVGRLARARAADLEVVAHGLSDHYRQIFTLPRLVEAIAIHDGEAAALAAA